MRFIKNRLWLVALGMAAVLVLSLGLAASRADAAPTAASVKPGVVAGRWISGHTPTVDGLRLRSAPSYRGRVKGQLYRGDALIRGNPRGKWQWVAVAYRHSQGGIRRGTSGWVHRSYLERAGFYRR
ncbi:SH3 domain-containing protein [Streptomyces flavidovirens]|uniref:SH3 domain-containing protein n=1 Tax=Streptomyces flavidovirens TaxID=67298 RepID=UPI003446D6A4